MTFFNFQGASLSNLAKLEYKSKSHNMNRAVIAAYYNVKKYGFEATSQYIKVQQRGRAVYFVHASDCFESLAPGNVAICEKPIFDKKEKEVCYSLAELFVADKLDSGVKRGISFTERKQVQIVDYRVDERLSAIYDGWKSTKESDPKTYLMTFNPARYLRTYELVDYGFSIYQKIVLINGAPYAVINFSLQNEYAYELSFLSLFRDPNLKLINDQNDCIIVNCLYDLYKNYGVQYVNLGTDAGIKGLKFFKRKMPHFENYIYRR